MKSEKMAKLVLFCSRLALSPTALLVLSDLSDCNYFQGQIRRLVGSLTSGVGRRVLKALRLKAFSFKLPSSSQAAKNI